MAETQDKALGPEPQFKGFLKALVDAPKSALAAVDKRLTTRQGRVAIGVAAFVWMVFWTFLIYGRYTVLWVAVAIGAVAAWLAATSRTPISIRLLSGVAFLLLLLFFDLPGRLIG